MKSYKNNTQNWIVITQLSSLASFIFVFAVHNRNDLQALRVMLSILKVIHGSTPLQTQKGLRKWTFDLSFANVFVFQTILNMVTKMKFQLFFCTVVTKVNFSPFQSSFANVFVFQTIGNAVTKMTFLLISVEYIFLTASTQVQGDLL